MNFILITLLLIFSNLNNKVASIEGNWISQDGKAVIKIYKNQKGNYYGLIIEDLANSNKIFDTNNPDPKLRSRKIKEIHILENFKMKSETNFIDGKIYDVDNGKYYDGILNLINNNKLEVRGYIKLPTFGKSVYWTRKIK